MNDPTIYEAEKEKLKIIIDHVEVGIIILDPDQNVTEVNKNAQEILSIPRAHLINKNAAEILHLLDENNDEVSPDTYSPKGLVDIEGIIFEKEKLNLINRNDQVKVVDFRSIRVKGASKLNIGTIIFIKNITQETELERMKIDFVSMAVHVLRTPLTVLKGYLSLLLHQQTIEKLDEKELDTLNSAYAGADELNSLVENLLHLSEIQQGKFHMYPTPINFEGIVSKVVAEYKPKVESKGLSLVYSPPLYEFPMVRADILRITEVLEHLLDNALKYTDSGFIEVSILKEPEGFVQAIVKDTGKGIPKENQHYIFTKFYRIKDPLEMDSAPGLGLYLSKKIIDAHNGEIWLESIEGQGSAFHFTLPVV